MQEWLHVRVQSCGRYLGMHAQERGERVVLIDSDPQGSLTTWNGLRKADLPTVAIAPIARLAEALKAAKGDGYAGAIVDMPGSLGPAEVRALGLASLVLVPARPSFLDLDATVASLAVIEANGRKAAIVLSQVRNHNREAATVRSALDARGLVLAPEIGLRIAFPDAIDAGLGVTESEPTSIAADEIRAVFDALRRVLQRG